MAPGKKYTLVDMQNIAYSKNGECLSTEYINVDSKLVWKCDKGHIWKATPYKIKLGQWCPICSISIRAEKKKLSIDVMKKIADERGGNCLSDKYIDSHTKLNWVCKNGHEWKATPNKINSGQWCPICSAKDRGKKRRLTIIEMQQLAFEKDGECLSEKYINSKSKLQWRCKKGHEWKATPNQINSGRWCPSCGGTLKLTIQEMMKIAHNRGGICLSKKYINNREKLKWQCSEGHVWESRPDKIKIGKWCPECSNGLSERICRIYFETIFNNKFPKAKPVWLINKENNQLELDGYCQSLNLAFEHQGTQHFKNINYFYERQSKKFSKRQCDDDIKVDLCRKHDVTLICIPELFYKIKLDDLKDFILNECKRLNYDKIPKDIDKISINLKKAYSPSKTEIHNTILKFVDLNNGKSLDKYLGSTIKMTFQCERNHIFKSFPERILKGKWCPKCSIQKRADSQKLTINDLSYFAEKKEGKLLSAEYVTSHTPLKWQCKLGHKWENSASNIKKGQWCPVCARKVKLTIEQMREYAGNKNGKCLSEKYIDNKTKLKWQCSEGHIWEARPSDIMRGKWCRICAVKKRRKWSVI